MVEKVAVVGGGVSGIASLWAMRQSSVEVHLYEASSELGGHANTVPYSLGDKTFPVDTGFIVFNKEAYPNFTTFLDALKVESTPTDMSFGVSRDDGQFEWGSDSFGSFCLDSSNLISPSYWRLLFDILRFNYTAPKVLSQSARLQDPHVSIGEFLKDQGYSQRFADDFLIPMVASPWCIDPDEFASNFPAAKLIRFMRDRRLLDTHSHTLRWHTVKNGSRSYVDAFQRTNPSHHHIHSNCPVKAVRRTRGGKTRLTMADGTTDVFDHVILAVHAYQALELLGGHASLEEREVLSAFTTSSNVCVLHSDSKLLPINTRARSAWNCAIQSGDENNDDKSITEPKHGKISVTFDMNRLQHIPTYLPSGKRQHALVSMNPIRAPELDTVQGTFVYRHPQFTAKSMKAESRLAEINGVQGISFAGAWMGCGFHEDGVIAGFEAANRLLPNALNIRVQTIATVDDVRPGDADGGTSRSAPKASQWSIENYSNAELVSYEGLRLLKSFSNSCMGTALGQSWRLLAPLSLTASLYLYWSVLG